MRYFFFGTLMDEDVFALVTGRPPVAEAWRPAMLPGFARRRVAGEGFPCLVSDRGGAVEGVLAHALGEAEAARLRFFEDFQYELCVHRVVTADGASAEALVNLSVEGVAHDPVDWDFPAWRRTEKAVFLRGSARWMALYGRPLGRRELNAAWGEIRAGLAPSRPGPAGTAPHSRR